MNDTSQWKDGWLDYEFKTANTLPEMLWKDKDWSGYAAFSTYEEELETEKMKEFQDAGKMDDTIGCLMELGAWRTRKDGVFEEIAVEREGKDFLIHTWCLSTPSNGKVNCYFREAETGFQKTAKKKVTFEKMLSMEVVVPDARLHFFITRS